MATSTPATTLYGIPNCDTVKKARTWLDQHGVVCRFHDFKREGVPAAALVQWIHWAGRDTLINRNGTTWRQLSDAQREAVIDDASAAALLSAQPSLIKRPVVEWADGRLTVGFDAAGWAAALKP